MLCGSQSLLDIVQEGKLLILSDFQILGNN